MGKVIKQPRLGRGAATGVFCNVCVETKGLILAPQEERYYVMSNGEFAGGGFSALLTTRGNSNLRPEIVQVPRGQIGPPRTGFRTQSPGALLVTVGRRRNHTVSNQQKRSGTDLVQFPRLADVPQISGAVNGRSKTEALFRTRRDRTTLSMSSGPDAEIFGYGYLEAGHVPAVPDRLQERIGEAEIEDIHDPSFPRKWSMRKIESSRGTSGSTTLFRLRIVDRRPLWNSTPSDCGGRKWTGPAASAGLVSRFRIYVLDNCVARDWQP